MKLRIAPLLVAAITLVALLGIARAAQADVRSIDHGGVYFGSVYVARGQTVNGDLNVMGGDLHNDGVVNGDVNVVGGNIVEGSGSMITGSSHVVGGEIVGAVVPWAPMEYARNSTFHMSWKVWLSALVIIFFLIFPLRTRMALDRLEAHPGLSAAIGLVGWVALIPLAILLCVTVILIPLTFVEFIGLICGVLIGKAALSLLIGRRLYETISPNTTASPIVALLLGLFLLTAAELIPFLGGLVTGFIFLIGLGAAILAFVREQAFTGPAAPTAGAPTTRSTISGPPMTIG